MTLHLKNGFSQTFVPPHGIIVVFPSHNTADPSSGIVSVPLVPWDEMTMAVHDSLAGSITDIISDIIPVRTKIIFNNGLTFLNKVLQCQSLFRGEGKIIRCVAEWHYQQVSLGYREPVPAGITQCVPCYDIIPER